MPTRTLLALFGFAAAFGAVAALVVHAALGRGVRKWKATRRAQRATRGEREAESLLAAAGWSIVGRQVEAQLAYRVDGARHDATVRADLVVERAGDVRVAEVKTGRVAPRMEVPTTRRQLLEYAAAFDADGVLLIDADRRVVHEVEMPRRSAQPRQQLWPVFVGGLLTGAALVAGWIYGVALVG
ncbi:MAG: hypothetical protein IT379_11170 [Deltaproteobacteria bacterium]|nr:hypothetical protein [Deltaproteobacteria bacterium]